MAGHNESSEEEGEEDEFARIDEGDDKQLNFNEYVEQRREAQSDKAGGKKWTDFRDFKCEGINTCL